jgi:enamine deaminase RidA (YjgF/YER057c/UK114 family)
LETRFELLAPTPNGYSQVARVPATSTLVYVSGQIAVAADGSIPDGWEAQTRLVMEHVAVALETGGATWADVFKLTIFVVGVDAIATIRRVRDEFVDPERPPTSSLVKVAGLVRPELLIEVEAIAALGT